MSAGWLPPFAALDNGAGKTESHNSRLTDRVEDFMNQLNGWEWNSGKFCMNCGQAAGRPFASRGRLL